MKANEKLVDTGINWEFIYQVEWLAREPNLRSPTGALVTGFMRVRDLGRRHKRDKFADRNELTHCEIFDKQWLRANNELWQVEIVKEQAMP